MVSFPQNCQEKSPMRNVLVYLGLMFGISISVNAANLLTVYQQALTSDPVFQQAVAQQLSDKENVPISFANLLPNIGVLAQPNVNKTAASGPATTTGSYSSRGYQVNATITQTIFNFAQFANLAGAFSTSKQADATLNAAAQSLMLRVSSAYFTVLQDEDNLRYAAANKAAYAKSLDQVSQQYKVGLKTITDVYTAQAAYDSSVAYYIQIETQLANDKENLRAITGYTYPSLAKLSEKFPFISPQPAEMESWVTTATKQNWSVKAAQYANNVALQNIKQQFAGHLPTLQAEGIYNITVTRNTGGTGPDGTLFAPPGAAQIAGISKIKADKEAIKSTRSSYEGLEAQYRVGTATLVDVLNQQQKLLQAAQQYSADRYAYINSLLTLKQAAGTLSPEDLAAINSWLGEK
jgi:outer membrane protein